MKTLLETINELVNNNHDVIFDSLDKDRIRVRLYSYDNDMEACSYFWISDMTDDSVVEKINAMESELNG